jgi:hypothetical protein
VNYQQAFVVDKVALGQVFSDCFGFPCHFAFHHLHYTDHHHHPRRETGSVGPLVTDVDSASLSPRMNKNNSSSSSSSINKLANSMVGREYPSSETDSYSAVW